MLNSREDELGRLILKLSHQIVKNRGRRAQEMGLTAGQADCLRFFSSREGASVTELKDHLGVTHQTAQGLVRRMAAKGLLSSRRSQKDSRVLLVSLSPQGQALAQQIALRRERTMGRLLRGVSSEEEKLLLHLLEQVYRNACDDGDRLPEEGAV